MDELTCEVDDCKNDAFYWTSDTKRHPICIFHYKAIKHKNETYVPIRQTCSDMRVPDTLSGDCGSSDEIVRILPRIEIKLDKEKPRDGSCCIVDECHKQPRFAAKIDKIPIVCSAHKDLFRDLNGRKLISLTKFCLKSKCKKQRIMRSAFC